MPAAAASPAPDEAKIGVVVPSWNSAPTLDWTLLSLRSQRRCVVQVVLADSGSVDAPAEICKRWCVETIYVPPGNMYRAVNAGMGRLNAPWKTYLNADDFVYDDSYARLVLAGESSGADVVFGNVDYVDGSGRYLHSFRSASPRVLRRLFRRGVMGFAQPAAIFRARVWSDLGGFSETYRHVSDGDFYARALDAGARFARLDGPSVCAFRLARDQLHQREAEVVRKEKAARAASSGGRAALADELAVTVWRATNLGNYAIRLLRTGSLAGK